jgi:hypothetical protein
MLEPVAGAAKAALVAALSEGIHAASGGSSSAASNPHTLARSTKLCLNAQSAPSSRRP